MTSFGPILLPQAAALILQHLTEQAVIPGTKIIYFDGSLLHAGSPEASLAFGVVHSVSNINFSVRGWTACHASSTKGELVELLAAIVSAPLNQKIDIQFDNQPVDHQFTSLASNRSSTLPSQWLWCPFARLWSVIHLLVQARGQEGHVLVTCVQDHANNAGKILQMELLGLLLAPTSRIGHWISLHKLRFLSLHSVMTISWRPAFAIS
ncbi:hypothetical protein MVEG_12420 [Podila verticillata NRRL 6337]|uniref:RNase H type-1 domain-containing protein n=1 Tax=Podila verticillata NRRL 6337 TaxID=1069443 RepID=A0A086TIG5_9FUNG|nr:hypothetical protein MVEG_12420 [Podila verticillata NRRL 6337]